MKKLILAALSFVLLLATKAQAQTNLVALPSATPHQITLNWNNACPSGTTCTFTVYRCTGNATVCTSTSTNWQLLTLTALSATNYLDTAVTQSTTYSYEVYAIANGDTSAPSNETSATVPQGPVTPTNATSTAQ